MAMVKTLDMTFKNEAGKKSTISIPDVRDDVTEVEVTAAMDLIIGKDVFATSGGNIVGKVQAQVVTKDATVLFSEE